MDTAEFWKYLDMASLPVLNIKDKEGNSFYGYKGGGAQEVLESKTIPARASFETRRVNGEIIAFVIAVPPTEITETK